MSWVHIPGVEETAQGRGEYEQLLGQRWLCLLHGSVKVILQGQNFAIYYFARTQLLTSYNKDDMTIISNKLLKYAKCHVTTVKFGKCYCKKTIWL